jgi:penicillin G amidase
MRRSTALRITALATVAAVGLGADKCPPKEGETLEVSCLSHEARVITDHDGVRHIVAQDDLDLACAQGWVHASDRFFQMDVTRRQISGDLAELLGPNLLGSDVQSRTIGLRRAAQRSYDAAPANFKAQLDAYAAGVNAWLASHPLPIEYAQLELTSARPWSPIDTLTIGKGISAQLSLDVDIDLTLQLDAYVQAGIQHGFDGQALFAQDVVRSAPMDPASTIPDATGGVPYASNAKPVNVQHLARAAASGRRVLERLQQVAFLRPVLERREQIVGSNEWGVTADSAAGGRPIIANDPHLALDMPSTFYEMHLVVKHDPVEGRMNVSGVGFPGSPGVILGQNEKITWGATTNPMDVTDTFLDTLYVGQPECALINAFACIESDGTFYPVDIQLGVAYFYNAIGDNVQDDLVQASLPPEQSIIATVPFRSFGPILDVTDTSVLAPPFGITTALVLQYTGFHATQELQTFALWDRAQNLGDFLAGLQKFDVGSQNWAYADVDGNLGYFTSAENPLRKDLEMGTVAGLPPYFIRDGSGPDNWVPDPAHSQGQTIPFAVMPYSEMPQTLNPVNGFFVNANNDPAGTTLDNDPLDQFRPSNPSAIYYLNPGYSNGLRAGRITRLVQAALAGGHKISVADMKEFQGNTQLLDAELLTPFIVDAFTNASAPGAPPQLAALAADPRIAEAAGRLATWDYSTPTGIPEGYDASDFHGHRSPFVKHDERDRSVAATIYNLWRGQAVKNIVDATLASVGLSAGAGDALKALHHLLVQSPFTGVGASGLDFFPQPAGLSPADRRDVALLEALGDALDLAASPAFAPAFGQSTHQRDYRWGKLHRIRFDHPLGGPFSVPPAGGFADLAPDLPGVSRDGGYEAVNASGYSVRAAGVNSFMFGSGPVRRYVGQPIGPFAVLGYNTIAGGPSGDPTSPEYTTQLGDWLTVDYHTVNMTTIIPDGTVDMLVPPGP